MHKNKTLAQWLSDIEALSHSDHIDLGLARMQQMVERLQLGSFNATIITVAGTNGKGTTVATLSALLQSHGKRVGTYTSPHLMVFNERICIQGQPVTDAMISDAFALIDTMRKQLPLTYFEWVTLAALLIFKAATLDYILLEVGLGGRLDAVNVMDADISIITGIDIDHTHYLGNTREAIALEKAGILRPNKPFFCGDPMPPATLVEKARSLSVHYHYVGHDYHVDLSDADRWSFRSNGHQYNELPAQGLHPHNLATALACFLSLGIKASQNTITHALENIALAGRCQWFMGEVNHLVDVSHNVQSVNLLASKLAQLGKHCFIVCGMLADKPLEHALVALAPYAAHWFLAPLPSSRTYTKKQMGSLVADMQLTNATLGDSVVEVYQKALSMAKKGDTIVVFGSFYTVAAILPWLIK